MDKFVRVDKKKDETPILDNEVRVTTVGRLHSYINYAASLIQEKHHRAVVLKGMGRAINKTVSLAEILKRRIGGLHQNTEIGSVDITDTWEPKEEGLNTLELTRHVSVITITLSSDPLDVSTPGYQPPVPDEEVKPLQTGEPERRQGQARKGQEGGRGRGRGHGTDGEPSGRGSGRGRGGVHGGRGRGRARGGGSRGGPAGGSGGEVTAAAGGTHTTDGANPSGTGTAGA